MEELATDDPGSHYVCQWQSGRRVVGLPTKRPRCSEGPERVCYLLLCYLNGYANTEQAVCHLQEHLPLGLSVPLVQEQQPEHLPSVPKQLCLCLDTLFKFTCT